MPFDLISIPPIMKKSRGVAHRPAIGQEIGVDAVVALTDLRLATNQINGSFETKDKRIEKYVKIVQ